MWKPPLSIVKSRPTVLLAAGLLLGSVLGGVRPAAAIRLEVEALQDAHNIGGGAIGLVACATASNGFAIDGIDMPGEWVELHLLLIEPACLYTAVRSAGLEGVVRNYRVDIVPEAPATTTGSDSLTTFPGTGIG